MSRRWGNKGLNGALHGPESKLIKLTGENRKPKWRPVFGRMVVQVSSNNSYTRKQCAVLIFYFSSLHMFTTGQDNHLVDERALYSQLILSTQAKQNRLTYWSQCSLYFIQSINGIFSTHLQWGGILLRGRFMRWRFLSMAKAALFFLIHNKSGSLF